MVDMDFRSCFTIVSDDFIVCSYSNINVYLKKKFSNKFRAKSFTSSQE